MFEKIRKLSIENHVGFDSLPDQLVNKSIQRGFFFNILCVGETGLGKSTLMDSLFNTNFDSNPSPHDLNNVKLKSESYQLQEKNVSIKLTITETMGFGDQVNKEDSFTELTSHLDDKFEQFLQEELKVKRCLSSYEDTRVHVCLYFISPNGHGLKSLDLACMKALENKVNIIPIIAKSDTMSKPELTKFKEKIMQEINACEIKIYQFPTDDESTAEENFKMNSKLPFAIVGSTDFAKVGNKMVRGRLYPWGTVQIENEAHCDFVKLREMLIRTNMQDLIELTHTKHYELYRKNRLESMGFSDFDADNKPQSFQQIFTNRMMSRQQEMEDDEEGIKQKFYQRVKVKEMELKEAENELGRKFEKIKMNNEREKMEIESQTRQLEDEMMEFNALKNQRFSLGKIIKRK